MTQVAQVGDELDRDRLVVSEAVVEVGTYGIRRPFAQQDPAGIAGEQAADDEDEHDDPEQDRDRDQEAADDVLRHLVCAFGPG